MHTYHIMHLYDISAQVICKITNELFEVSVLTNALRYLNKSKNVGAWAIANIQLKIKKIKNKENVTGTRQMCPSGL